MTGNDFDYDVIVIGSGFGGSVAACARLRRGIASRCSSRPALAR